MVDLTNIKTCFISHPITGQEEFAKEHCAQYKKSLSEKYPHVNFITPFEINLEKDKPTSYYMGKDIEILIDCDAIVSAPTWQFSKGCQVERFTANIYGLRIFDMRDLLEEEL